MPSTMQTWGVCTLLLIGNLLSSPIKCVTVTVYKAFFLTQKTKIGWNFHRFCEIHGKKEMF